MILAFSLSMKGASSLAMWIVLFMLTSCSQGSQGNQGSQGSQSFEDQIRKDVDDHVATGICDNIPAGSVIRRVHIASISPMEGTGLIRVKVEFDVEKGAFIDHIVQSMLYAQEGERYMLESISGCRYVKP